MNRQAAGAADCIDPATMRCDASSRFKRIAEGSEYLAAKHWSELLHIHSFKAVRVFWF